MRVSRLLLAKLPRAETSLESLSPAHLSTATPTLPTPTPSMKSPLHATTRHIKNFLAARYDLVHLKRWAFVIALFSCLSLGSIMLFSLFARSLHNAVGLTYTEINFIVSLSAVGMYLCLPVLGYLADKYSPALLTLISIWAFCPAYAVNAYLVKASGGFSARTDLDQRNLVVMAVSFCFIGLATSSLYFLSLLTCARIYPNHKSMAISMPVTCYGISSLIGSQIMKIEYFKVPGSPDLDLYRVFRFFAVLYFVVGILNFVANSIVTIEQEVIFGDQEPLLAPDSASESAELAPLQSHRLTIEPVDHRARYIRFLKDKSAWVLLVSLILNVGPLESFQNNLGLIVDFVSDGSVAVADQVSWVAALSTCIRLLIGVIADWILSPERRYPVCKVWFLFAVTLLGAAGQLAALYAPNFTAVSVLSGLSYGGLFTIYPTIIASIWGVDMMGSTWGSFMVAPAIGSISFSLFYGLQVDRCGGSAGCLDNYFRFTAFCLAASSGFVLFAWRGMWWGRGYECI